MPTDIVELCIATCCIVSMVLMRSPVLAPGEGLDRSTRAVATGMASTVMLVISNSLAFLLSTALASASTLPPSTTAITAPLVAVIVAAAVIPITITATAKIHSAIHRLLANLGFAIVPVTLLLAAITAMVAPAQNLFHAALTAVGAGFGFTLLLRLCAVVTTTLDTATDTAMPRESTVDAIAPPPTKAWQIALRRVAEHSAASTLLLASLLAMLGTVFYTGW